MSLRAASVFIFSSVIMALVLAVGIIIMLIRPPASDVRLLVLFMSATAAITLGFAYLFQRLNFIEHFPSLRWIIPVTIVLTAILIVFNVWVTARLMFISDHDFYLTTALLIFASLIATGFGVFITTHLTQRLAHLSIAAATLATGQFDTRLEVKGNDEIAQLAQTFNAMTESLGKIEAQKRAIDQTRRDLIAWVSHDLRTPLTTIRAMLEAIEDGVVEDEATQQRYMQNSLREIEHLSHLINDLFELAQIDTGQLNLNIETSSLRTLIAETLSNLNAQAERQGVTLSATLAEDVDVVAMDTHKIQQVLYNLLDNAIRYTPEQGTIQLKAQWQGAEVQIDIHNSGATIAPDHLPHLFESFYRADKSRTPDQDGRRGTGLGLTIARRFVEAHQGRIWVESGAGLGTTFSFTLPRKAS
jgi:signal transduction histidine kinase